MRSALLYALLRGLRTAIQGLAGVAGSFPLVYSLAEAKVAAAVAAYGALGAVIAGVAAFLQNLAERLEALESE